MKTKLLITILLIIIIVGNIIPTVLYADNEYGSVKAKVVEIVSIEEILEDNITQKVQKVDVRILEGEYEDEEYEMTYIISKDVNGATSNLELKEDDVILVSINEDEGEVTGVSYLESINQNYALYVLVATLIILALVIARKNAIKPLIVFIFTVFIILGMLFTAVMQNWNLILISSLVSICITIVIAIKVNGINKKTSVMISCSILGTAIAGILTYLFFDLIKINNVNIKVIENFVNIKDLFCSSMILTGGLLSNIIVLSSLNMFNFLNKPYKRKSDNIIEGQRSLKL